MPADVYIRVPKTAWSQLSFLLETDPDKITQIVRFLAASSPMNDVEDLAEACQAKTGIPAETVEALVMIAMNVCNLKRDYNLSASDVFQRIAVDLSQEQFPNWREKFAAQWNERTALMDPLLIADGPMDVMAKARMLLFEFQCVLQDSAVLTDVRHIYSVNATEVVGGLVLHTLALKYREGSDDRQTHITMSESDIDKIIKQFTRAKAKSVIALRILADSHIVELSPKRTP